MITVKDTAIEYFDKIASGKIVTFGLKGAGCSGFSYDFNVVEEVDETYDLIKYETFSLAIDKTSSMYLLGSSIDYTTDIMGSRIVVDNPLVKSTCGCKMSVNF